MFNSRGLPYPATITEMYLAAILEELEGLRKDLINDDKVLMKPQISTEITYVKEPEPTKRSKKA
jgi:hypothetical protein